MAIEHMFGNKVCYLIVKNSLTEASEHCILFNDSSNIKKVINVILKSNTFTLVSAGGADIDIDARKVTCYSVPSTGMKPRESDASAIALMLKL